MWNLLGKSIKLIQEWSGMSQTIWELYKKSIKISRLEWLPVRSYLWCKLIIFAAFVDCLHDTCLVLSRLDYSDHCLSQGQPFTIYVPLSVTVSLSLPLPHPYFCSCSYGIVFVSLAASLSKYTKLIVMRQN